MSAEVLLTCGYAAVGVVAGVVAARDDAARPDAWGEYPHPGMVTLTFVSVAVLWPVVLAFFLVVGFGALLTWGIDRD